MSDLKEEIGLSKEEITELYKKEIEWKDTLIINGAVDGIAFTISNIVNGAFNYAIKNRKDINLIQITKIDKKINVTAKDILRILKEKETSEQWSSSLKYTGNIQEFVSKKMKYYK